MNATLLSKLYLYFYLVKMAAKCFTQIHFPRDEAFKKYSLVYPRRT